MQRNSQEGSALQLFSYLKFNEGNSFGLSSVFVLGQEDTPDISEGLEEVMQIL